MDVWLDPALAPALAQIASALDWAERELPSSCSQWWSAPSQQAFAHELWQLQQRIALIEHDVQLDRVRATGYG